MSKKSRRQRRLNLPPEAYNVPTSAPAPRPAATSATTTASAAAAAPRDTTQRDTAQRRIDQVNWQAEYGDVLGDLKRTGILAVGIMAVMIVLSFIIR